VAKKTKRTRAPKQPPKPPALPEFNMFTWSDRIPLIRDDLWLGMQARNLVVVDMQVIRHVELQALMEYFRDDRTPIETLMLLSALSQMWIFALYELLRTWRERAKHLIRLADEYRTVLERKKSAFLEKSVVDAKAKEKHITHAITMRSEHVARVGDPDFMSEVRAYFDRTDGLFREIESVRVFLAKHEIQGTRGSVARAPGYARMSYENGSLYWQYEDKEGYTGRSERREIADGFFEIGTVFGEPDFSQPEGAERAPAQA
jgi:hypothetical protein